MTDFQMRVSAVCSGLGGPFCFYVLHHTNNINYGELWFIQLLLFVPVLVDTSRREVHKRYLGMWSVILVMVPSWTLFIYFFKCIVLLWHSGGLRMFKSGAEKLKRALAVGGRSHPEDTFSCFMHQTGFFAAFLSFNLLYLYCRFKLWPNIAVN